MPTKLYRIKKRHHPYRVEINKRSSQIPMPRPLFSTLESVGGIYSSQQLEVTPGPPNLNFEIPKQVERKKCPSRQHPTLKFGERGGVRVGKNKYRLQYPGCGVLSSELWRRITNPFFRDDRLFIPTRYGR